MSSSDLWFSEDGDYIVGYDGDLKLAYDLDYILQSIATRTKSDAGEWLLHPEIGMSLSSLIGKQMTQETLTQGEDIISSNILFDGLLSSSQLKVTGIPISKAEALFIIEVLGTNLKRMAAVSVPFDFLAGVNLEGVKAIGSDTVYSL
jgi:hypothetical protein